MSILVTGGTGFIGSHTCVELLNSGFELVIMDNFYNSKPECLKRITEITGKSFKFYECDLLDKNGLRTIYKENDIESVVHFAGLKSVGESVQIPLKYYHNNISGTINLLEIMKEYQSKSIVFSSSSTVYGSNNKVPYTEDMPVGGCTNPYGQTKFMIEHILKDVAFSDPEWKISVLRYFNPIGAHESGLIGEDPNGIPNNLMPYITQVAVGKLERVNVYGNDYNTPDGTGIRDYIHVVDLAKGHLKALQKLKEQNGIDFFNLGTGRGYSVLEVINSFEKESGQKVPFVIVDRRAGDLAESYADVSKARSGLDFVAEYDLDRMCKDSYRWQANNPNGM